MNEKIYSMEVHESFDENEILITRVPNGWIYRFWDIDKNDYGTTGVFVPMTK